MARFGYMGDAFGRVLGDAMWATPPPVAACPPGFVSADNGAGVPVCVPAGGTAYTEGPPPPSVGEEPPPPPAYEPPVSEPPLVQAHPSSVGTGLGQTVLYAGAAWLLWKLLKGE